MSADDETLGEVTPVEATQLLSQGAYLLDVRENDEWEAGHALQAHHIALGDLELGYQEIPQDRTVVCVCRGGGRSARAAEALAGVGYTTMNLAGGMRAWAAAELEIVNEAGTAGEVI
jgi:rhodanese-related sulfurtransferase